MGHGSGTVGSRIGSVAEQDDALMSGVGDWVAAAIQMEPDIHCRTLLSNILSLIVRAFEYLEQSVLES